MPGPTIQTFARCRILHDGWIGATILPPELIRNEQEFWDWERYITVFKDGFESGDLTGGAWTAVSP